MSTQFYLLEERVELALVTIVGSFEDFVDHFLSVLADFEFCVIEASFKLFALISIE